MDFPSDTEGHDCNSEYMFGKSLLVAPVVNAQYTPETVVNIDENTGWDKSDVNSDAMTSTEIDFMAPRSTMVYLPAGTDWYDFNSGQKYQGGQTIEYPVTIKTIPVFARAGSIIPIGPDVQFATEKPWDRLELKVYPGADGSFTLYEDEGDGYNYKKGVYSTIDMTYSRKNNTVTIHNRKGTYPGMLTSRKFLIKDMSTGKTYETAYNGKKTVVKLN